MSQEVAELKERKKETKYVEDKKGLN